MAIFDGAIFDGVIFDVGDVAVIARGGRGGEEHKRFDRIRYEDEELLIMMPVFVETMRKWI
jgi:hypothetical protein